MESNRRQAGFHLKLELSASNGASKQEWDTRLQEWAREVVTFRAQLEEVRDAYSRQSLGLRTGGIENRSSLTAEQKSAMRGLEVLEEGTRKLQAARDQLVESEGIG